MSKKVISFITSLSLAATMAVATIPLHAITAEATTQYTRVMDYLDRGVMAIPKTGSGMFLSWRLLGTESLKTTTFDIYKNGDLFVEDYDGTSYTDTQNSSLDTSIVYNVVKHGQELTDSDLPANTIKVNGNNVSLSMSYGKATSSLVNKGYSETNYYGYFDIPLNTPSAVSDSTVGSYTYSVNDCSVGDVDGDGEYEIIVKWYPSNAKDNSDSGYTGKTLLSCYEMDGTELWNQPIDLGYNIRSGAHYTQFMVYDFDLDGIAEVVCKTAPGSIDATGAYVSTVGNTSTIRSVSNSSDYRNSSGHILSGEEYLTVFNGATGKAIQTIDYTPLYGVCSWGDTYGNRGNRMLATVAYLGATDESGNLKPSVVMCRGYYTQVYIVAYDWDGTNLTQRFYNKSTSNSSSTLYGQGNHNLVASDVDNDGYDEIVYGSAVLDNDGSVLSNTRLGHGDALHVSDFNNDGNQEVYQVHEDSAGYANYGMDYRDASSGSHYFGVSATGDVGRGVMDNIDDEYASSNSNGLSLAWSSASDYAYDTAGNQVAAKPNASSRTMTNSLIYWDGSLDRELLDDAIIAKYHASTGATTRFYCGSSGSFSFSTNNDSKYNACLSADILGDWREEVIGRVGSTGEDQSLRVYISAIDTNYKLTTLMHDSQYRTSVATENVGYNQPPHLSYYVGSAALASSSTNYLAPNTPFTKVTYADVYNSSSTETTTTLYSEDFEGSSNSFSLINSSLTDNEYWESDSSTTNAMSGTVYGVGARAGGDTGTQSSSIDTSSYSKANVSLDFKMDACASGKSSNISLIGSPCTANYLSSSSQIITLSASASGNGYWGSVSINGEDITSTANVSNGTSNGESSGKGGLLRDTTGWINMNADIDFDTQTADVTLTRISDGSIVYSDTVDFVNTVSSLSNIYMAGGKAYGSVWLDNVKVSGIGEASDTSSDSSDNSSSDEAISLSWSASKDITSNSAIMDSLCAVSDLTYSASSVTIDNTTFSGYVSSTLNGGWSSGAATGTAFKFTAPVSGTLNAYIANLGSTKTAYITKEGTSDYTTGSVASISGTEGTNVKLSAYVTEGDTYYIYVKGSKGRFTGFTFYN